MTQNKLLYVPTGVSAWPESVCLVQNQRIIHQYPNAVLWQFWPPSNEYRMLVNCNSLLKCRLTKSIMKYLETTGNISSILIIPTWHGCNYFFVMHYAVVLLRSTSTLCTIILSRDIGRRTATRRPARHKRLCPSVDRKSTCAFHRRKTSPEISRFSSRIV